MPLLLFPKSNGFPAVPSMVFTEPTRSFVFTSPFPPAPTVCQLGLDMNGVSEQTNALYDFSAFPEIKAGDTIALSPAPIIGVSPNTLTLGAVSVSGAKVLIASINLTGGIISRKLVTSCTVKTAAGLVLICYGDYVLIGAN